MNVAVAVGKLLRRGIRLFRRGGGSALPGLVASKLDPKLLQRSFRFPQGMVIVTGSAGKSSTTKLLVDLLRQAGLRVFTNPSTANIEQGLVSAVLQQSNLSGRLDFDIAVLEVDEGHAATLVQRVRPRLTVITNLMVDQIDRFVDPRLVLAKLESVAIASEAVITNADDANLDQLPAAKRFGSSSPLQLRADYPEYAPAFKDPAHAPDLLVTALNELDATLRLEGHDFVVRLAAPGMHVALNTAAALLASKFILGADFNLKASIGILSSAQPVFARDEHLELNGVSVRLMLVQNPAGFRLNLGLLQGQPERLMIAIGTDVHDPSWLWSVDFSSLERVDLVSGANAAELALRLTYQEIEVSNVDPDIAAVDEFLEQSEGKNATIIVSADAMRRLRRHLGVAQ